jgi:hypothetical protein
VVVDDHQGHCHLVPIVVTERAAAYTVSHTMALRRAGAGDPPHAEPPPRDLTRDSTKLDPW